MSGDDKDQKTDKLIWAVIIVLILLGLLAAGGGGVTMGDSHWFSNN